MSFILLSEYARAKSKLINELENLPPAEIVRYFLLLSTIHEKYKLVISPIGVHF